MYGNISLVSAMISPMYDKPQHLMYGNRLKNPLAAADLRINLNI